MKSIKNLAFGNKYTYPHIVEVLTPLIFSGSGQLFVALINHEMV